MENEHEQLVSMVNQLLDERDKLSRENEYLKAKLNQSILLETIHDMKKERDLLFQLLTNLTVNQKKDETNRFVRYQVREKYISRFSNEKKNNKNPYFRQQSTAYIQNPTPPRFKSNYIQPIRTDLSKSSQTNSKIQTKPFRPHDILLKHSQNSPFKHYRSQSLQDLT